MTPQDRELIAQLFARLNQAAQQPKDPEAEASIRRGIDENPDAPYLLVQTVLIQDMALTHAQNRLAELERQVAAAPQPAPAKQPTSFLGTIAARGSVPDSGPWRAGTQPQNPAPQPAPVWTDNTARNSGVIPAQTWSAGMPGAAGPGLFPGAGSGFLRAAAATAIGVAGGQLLFQGIESMFGYHAGGILGGMPMQPALSETVINNYYGDERGAPVPPAPDTHSDFLSPGDASSGGIVQADYDPGQDQTGQDQTGQDFGNDESPADPGFGGDDSFNV